MCAGDSQKFGGNKGGNGTGFPIPQQLLINLLPKTFIPEYPVKTYLHYKGYPPNYKIDIAYPEKKLGIEIDGASHRALVRKAQDKKKDTLLRLKGWTILRFKNEEVLEDVQLVISKILEKLNG